MCPLLKDTRNIFKVEHFTLDYGVNCPSIYNTEILVTFVSEKRLPSALRKKDLRPEREENFSILILNNLKVSSHRIIPLRPTLTDCFTTSFIELKLAVQAILHMMVLPEYFEYFDSI